MRPKAEKHQGGSAEVKAYDSLVEEEKFVLQATPSSGAAAIIIPGKGKDAFDLFDSTFAARRILSDSRAFYDDVVVTQRGFELDFARCNQVIAHLLAIDCH